ncbi:hypothetical protein K0B96_15355 [Horticoccus luteus]|uniref:ABC exporter n=1 Tax=Horticoccus luteus TaxID=2862869 RepID=A0A8F9TTA4_9BACT|nr:putative ABC exporter domain-containing protein [Horticoccus luteus]QYM78661.1 hypothetical protein K0B96_15355 [Horticoccus luteus]
MLRALLYLRLHSLRNLVVTRARRLRQPRYFAAFVVGGLYFWWFFFRPLIAPSHGRHLRVEPIALPADFAPLLLGVAAVVLLVILAFSWIAPGPPRSLAFSEAEIAFLFPAPITRRRLVHYKLLNSQFSIFFTSLFFTLLTRRWSFLGGNLLMHAFGWWVVLSTVNLHFTGAALTLLRLSHDGARHPTRRLWGLALLALAAVAAGVWFHHPPLPATDLTGFTALARYVSAVLATPPLSWLLWPARAVLHPFFAADASEFLAALAPAALVLLAHYGWVVRIDAPFAEASLLQAQRRAARVAAWRAGSSRLRPARLRSRSGPFALAPAGRPEIAFLWKNLLSTRPYFRPRVALATGVALAAVCLWLRQRPDYAPLQLMLLTAAAIFAAYTWLIGPQLARQDLRSDLGNSDIFKTYPLHGWQIILGQVLTPTAILTVLVWLALLVVSLCLPASRIAWLTAPVHLAATVSAAALVPLLCTLQLLIPTAATVFFPAWFHATRGLSSTRGIEVLGQRLIFVIGQLITVLIAIVPVAGVGALVIFLLQWLIGLVGAVLVATVVMAGILLLEIAVGLHCLGRRFERFDLSAELRP